MREDARERRQLRQEYERLKGINSSVRSVLRTMVPPSTAGSTISVTSNVKGKIRVLSLSRRPAISPSLAWSVDGCKIQYFSLYL